MANISLYAPNKRHQRRLVMAVGIVALFMGGAIGAAVTKSAMEIPLYNVCEFTPQSLMDRVATGWDINSPFRTPRGENYPVVLLQIFDVKCQDPEVDLAYVYLMNDGLISLKALREIMLVFNSAQREQVKAALGADYFAVK